MAKIATRQHGVVSLGQLRRAGLSETTVRRHVARGSLHRVHRGVYAVGHPALSAEGRWLAAVLAVGGGPNAETGSVLDYWGAVVSHGSAACLWGLLPVTDHPADVSVPGDGGRAKRRGVRVHRSQTLVVGDVTLRRGIPVTRPARTIADLRRATAEGWAGAIPARELRKAIRQANVLALPIEESDTDPTRGDLEGNFLRLCARHRIPSPEINVRIGPYLVDFLWRDRRLVVETDSYLHHRGKAAFREDRGRSLALKRLGYEALRLSEQQVNEEPDQVAETLSIALGAGRS
jgi:hypothetical protein